jgi:hypothetical protein
LNCTIFSVLRLQSAFPDRTLIGTTDQRQLSIDNLPAVYVSVMDCGATPFS